MIRGLDSSAVPPDDSPLVAAGDDSGGVDCPASMGFGVSDSGDGGAALGSAVILDNAERRKKAKGDANY